MIRATDWRPLERNTLRGFVTLELPSGLILRECTYHRTTSGAEWIGLPGRAQIDREGKQRKDPATGKSLYTPIVELKGKAERERFQAAALAAVHELLATMESVA
jgi:hypothetical protein